MAAPTVPGAVFMADEGGRIELHHRVPQCLLRLWDEANRHGVIDGAAIQAWMKWEHEALLWGVDPEISRHELAALIDVSTVPMSRDDHRALHGEGGDFARWGRRGGLETLKRHGRAWFRKLALRRHGRITTEELRAGLLPAPALVGA